MNARQTRFVEEYLIDLNATQAAIRAGYNKATAYSMGQRLLKNVEIKKKIEEHINERSKRTEITADSVLKIIAETVDRCRQVEPVVDSKGMQVFCKNRDGNVVPAFIFNSAGVLKGCELLGKHVGLFKEKDINLNMFGGVVQNVVLTGREGHAAADGDDDEFVD